MDKYATLAVCFLLVLSGVTEMISLTYAVDTVTLWEDTAGFWENGAGCTLSTEYSIVKSGGTAVKIETSGASWFHHTYSSTQNFASYEYANFYWYGNASADTFVFSFYDSDQSGYFRINMYDNFKGWRLYSLPFSEMQLVGDATNATLTEIKYIMVEGMIDAQEYYIDKVWLSQEEVTEEVTSQMISTDWLTFGGLVFLSVLGVIFVLKSRNFMLNFIFGAITFGAGAYFSGTEMVLSGWINLLAIMMGVVCMLDAIVLWRSG